MYLLVTLLIAVIAFHTQANLLFWAFGVMVGALVVSLVIGVLVLRRIEVRRLLPEHAVAGEPAALRYEISNRSLWLPVFGLVLTEAAPPSPSADERRPRQARWVAAPATWVLHIGPRQTVHTQAACHLDRRGELALGSIVLTCAFPFGILERRLEIAAPATLLVYPRLYRIQRRLLERLAGHDPTGRRFVERGGGVEEFFGLREYRAGDSLKTVDWKHSARFGKLVAREMTKASVPRLRLTLDLRRTEDEPLTEAAIDLAASLICDAYFHGHEVGMTILGASPASFMTHHSLPHRTHMLNTLARLETNLPGDAAHPDALETSQVSTSPHGPATVIIAPRAAAPVPAGIMVLSAEELASYVREAGAGDAYLQPALHRARSQRWVIEEAVA